jgi:hypothetical protein
MLPGAIAHNTANVNFAPRSSLDPLLIALLKKVPQADKGWPGPARVRWFRTFAMNVSQIYDGDGDPVEMKIELEKVAAN